MQIWSLAWNKPYSLRDRGDSWQAHESPFVHPDELRTAFALAMSHMYKNEVPLYGDLVRIVQGCNKQCLLNMANGADGRTYDSDNLDRLTLERHGAIRLGKPEELRTVRRIFSLLGMQPVGYYDLSVARLPMHATCFRPIDTAALESNPFRVFTTLLRPELIRSQEARELALRLLARRHIFSPELMRILDVAEKQDSQDGGGGVGGRLRATDAEVFIREALRTFSWAPVAEATHAEYQVLRAEHPILADIACFRTAHINHLTPRTLDIDAAQAAMAARAGMAVKDRIEGPPRRRWPILLRQTSFLALEEPIRFKVRDDDAVELIDGSHKARFGEIEERGAAVTPAGRALYDQLLDKTTQDLQGQSSGSGSACVEDALAENFKEYPDTWTELRKRGLVYIKYDFTGRLPSWKVKVDEDMKPSQASIECLIEDGVFKTAPINYEDFLPFSAAGIFQSNLNQKPSSTNGKQSEEVEEALERPADVAGMERALGCSIINPDDLYSRTQKQSLESSLSKLRSAIATSR
ncbi:hypothetical protein BX600DRAFT_529095 [Xylariales sp. PMI_506]|nr:hypothetical protein BX600DRAFT_529095 [Xylariales sp. PMI_506]